jgi:type IV pilus assembly protein PilN
MARINLLPWRAERRKQREREFYTMLGLAAVAAIVVLGGVIWFMDQRIENQQARNKYLQDEITALDSKIAEIKDLEKTKSRLLQRKQIIEQLQASRSQMVHLFDELVKTIPDGAKLSQMKQAGDTLTLEGVAQSNASVATYMRNLDASQWLSKSDLKKTEVKRDDKKSPYSFALDVKLRRTETDETIPDASGAAPGTTTAPKPTTPPAPAQKPGAIP